MNFSERTNWNMEESEFSLRVRARRAAHRDLFDLTLSNPTHCGFSYDPELIFAPLADQAALQYQPASLGEPKARAAVAKYYLDAGAVVSHDHICLTTSTSEAYSFLFRLLCDVGDEVLVARPSYPLFEYIARCDGVLLREYPLLYDPNDDLNDGSGGGDGRGGWIMDLHSLEAAITPRTRAVVVVHPNNPTGNFVSAAQRVALEALCVKHRLALIVDEVFLDYPFASTVPSFTRGSASCLSFVVSGISKICALPQMKVSWLIALGPGALVQQSMQRIEVIADTFLSMNTPCQRALPHWLESRHLLQAEIRQRTRANVQALDERLRNTAAQRLALEGGWTAVLRVPRTVQERDFADAALDAGVLVQPGHFYGMDEGRVVLSLITPPETWQAGLRRLPID
jgi:alanine-synthesizing transaminase